jgi:thymidine phosphorylase
VLPKPAHREEVSLREGRITAIDSEALGIAALILGAGRRKKEDTIDPAAGLVVDAYLGEVVQRGAAPQVMLHHSLAPGDARVAEARAMIENAFVIDTSNTAVMSAPGTRILEVIR